MTTLGFIIVSVVFALIALIVIGIILSRLYRRASKQISFVRTGFGGQKVIMSSGALVFPVLHEIILVNMNTLRLEVQRTSSAALITRDRMRVDVQAEFYVRVKPTAEAIADAAQTLGKRTMDPTALKDLVEGKFVDALRAVAAEMTMEELHEQRVDFVQKVQAAVTEDLLKNGLELESVSLTALDQTDQKHFNPQNAFDARGLTKLTEEIQARLKQRNVIERDTEVAIQEKNLEAERKKLELSREEEYARLEQQREIDNRRAEQQANIAQEKAGKDREAKEAEIMAKQQVDKATILAERQVEEERIAKDQYLKEREIAKSRSLETAEIEREKSVKIADQDRAIAVAEKSKEHSVARSEADKARALAAQAEEAVTTARDTEIAERDKAIELVEARKSAERQAIGITVAAEAEKKAALDLAEAIRIKAQADADRITTNAEAESRSEILKTEAAAKRYAAEAEGERARNEAENILDQAAKDLRFRLALVENLDRIIRESVKPMERIDGIKIINIGGLGGSHGTGQEVLPGSGDGNLADQVVNSALRYRGQAPLVDALMKEIGLSGSDINGLTDAIKTGGGGQTDGEGDPSGEEKP